MFVPIRPLSYFAAILLLVVSAAAQNFQFTPTTTLAKEAANNTSAADSFAAQTNGNAAAANTSRLDIRNLLYPGATTSIYAHFMPWFGQASHMNVGYSSNDATQVKKQVDDMVGRGIQGVVIDWYGSSGFPVEDGTTQKMKAEAESRSGFVFAVMEDVGALNKCANTAGCDVTQKVITDLNYAYTNYMQSPAYMKWNGRPLVYFFGVDKYTINWDTVAASIQGNPALIFQGTSGFSHKQSSGSFSWIAPNATNPDDEGLSYLDNFYTTSKSYSTSFVIGSAYTGFNNSLAPWIGSTTPKVMKQKCGQTWMDTLARTSNHFSTSNQLPAIQLVTWNDYEEGTEIESGIDNCVSVSAAMTGTALTWSLNGKENTVDHYTIFISNDSTNLMKLGDVASGTHTYDTSGLRLDPSVNYWFFVQAIGQPSIHNQMSAAVPYTATNNPPTAALTVSPTSGTVPLSVNASLANSTDSDGSIASYAIDFGDGTVVNTATASHTYNAAGTFTVKGTVTDNLGAAASATQSVTASSASTCSVSTSNRTITICAPAANSTVATTFRVTAYATDKRTVSSMSIYVDGVVKYQVSSVKKVDTNITTTVGTHTLKVSGRDSLGTFSKAITISAK